LQYQNTYSYLYEYSIIGYVYFAYYPEDIHMLP
jgi:hypothetical protein